MLGRNYRFHGHNSLNAAYRNGATVRGPQLTLKIASRDPSKPYRVAVVVSRKVSKSAVQRNRIRRRIYEIVRRHEDLVSSGQDLIFTAFGDHLATIEAPKLEAIIVQLLTRSPK